MTNLLDQKYATFNIFKIGLAIPAILAGALVEYISYTFIWRFIPEMMFKVSASQNVLSFLYNINFDLGRVILCHCTFD